MRSTKSRSRNKNNRNRSVGNVINRVFDSSGPEGKVRGTPQQIIEKYNQLARDAFLGNDRVAAENFQQHAEHYTRLLAEAQREADAQRLQHEQQQRERQSERDRERNERNDRRAQQGDADMFDADASNSFDVVEAEDEVGLVETPETKAAPEVATDAPEQSDEGSAEKPQKRAPKPRAPRKPRKKPEDGAPEGSAEAAE